jgi:tRNA A-37 threonylcarbamoyl transferase component Bud32
MDVLPEIASRFDVLAKLGEGGMGCVYKVRHRDLDEVQIVKTLQAHLSGDEALRNRFINEARRGMRLRHPHIAGVHDFQVCADGTGFIVMEYVDGLNLRDLLSMRGPLSLSMVGTIASQTLDALAYLHSEKFVHRDISPDNLMLARTADGRPFLKLIDLGISKSLDAGSTMTATGQFLGKVSYASPEQFGGQLDGRSDLYSLGVVLYKLLTNADPFATTNYRELIAAHLFQRPRPFSETAPDRKIPEAVQQVVFRALEKDPDARYADASEFRVAVEEAFDVQGTSSSLARPVVTRPARTDADATPRTQVDTTIVTGMSVPAAATEAATLIAGDATVIDHPVAGVRSTRIRYAVLAALAICILALAATVVRSRMTAARIAGYGKFYAVVIGESQYRKFESLPTAVDDARAVSQLLSGKYGFTVTRLENAKAQQILDAVRATGKQMTNRDNLLVFYAGHGELKGGKGYWQPVDADFEMNNWLSPAVIRDVLLDHPARRTLVIADSCYSGALVRGALQTAPTADRAGKRSRIIISSGGDAPIIDSADGHHSVFTRALLEVLGDPAEDTLDVQTLFPPIRDRVIDSARRAGHEQHPELSVIAEVGDEGGTFYFGPRQR